MRIGIRLGLHLGSLVLVASAMLAGAAPVASQEWPNRTVKFILPFGPGSSADVSARIVAERMQAFWGKAVVVEPRPGGDALIAINAFVGANDDHALFFGPSSSFVAHRHRYVKLSYDLGRDMLPVAQLSTTTVGLAVPSSSSVRSLADFIAAARANPGKMNVAAAPGTTEMMLDVFVREQKLDVVKVPYRDIVQGTNDLSLGRLQGLLAAVAIFQAGVQGDTLRLIAVSGQRQTDAAPGVPTADQQGYPRLAMEGLMGVFAPRAMSEEARKKLETDFLKVISDPDIARRLGVIGQVHAPGDTKTFTASIARQQAEVDEIARLIGMQPK